MSMGGERKRAFSTPHITPAISRMLTDSFANAHGNSSGCINVGIRNAVTDENINLWSRNTALSRDANMFTSLAMGDERYKLQNEELFTRESSVGTEDDDDEAKDQFSPTLYSLGRTRSIPIPISADNSPQHMPLGINNPQSPTHTASALSTSPYFSSSPETNMLMGNRLNVPMRRHTQPQMMKPRAVPPSSPSSLKTPLESSSSAVLFASSPTSSMNRLATH